MGISTVYRHEVTGLKEFHKWLTALGVTDTAIKNAMNAAGQPLANEVIRLAPQGPTGKLKASVKVNKAKSLLRITVGNNTTVKYAYNWHAIKLGRSGGWLTAVVPAKGSRAGYNRVFPIPNNPFAYVAAMNKQQEVLDTYVTEIEKITISNPPAPVVI